MLPLPAPAFTWGFEAIEAKHSLVAGNLHHLGSESRTGVTETSELNCAQPCVRTRAWVKISFEGLKYFSQSVLSPAVTNHQSQAVCTLNPEEKQGR